MNSTQTVRTRFAPSPTGHLHVGGARTALFNYLYSRHHHGQFLLRIEDTDKERSDVELTESILDSLKWLDLSWDEPKLYQSQQEKRHQEICKQLLEKDLAYRCFCSPENLTSKRKIAQEQDADTKYDRSCINLSQDEITKNLKNQIPYTLRFRVPDGKTTYQDLVHGSITVQHKEIDDFVIQRSDGSPVYQIAVVVDDHDMGITHVIRGDDHLSNTPKQILLYQAMGWNLPQFGHVPLILGTDKKRLSKRHGASSIEAYRDQGVLPQALINFLALLGWSPGDDREILDLKTMIQAFSLDRISKKSAVFDTQKLEWMNASYISDVSNDILLDMLYPKLIKLNLMSDTMDTEQKVYLNRILDLLKPRLKMMNDFMDQANYFFHDPTSYEEKAVQKHLMKPEVQKRLILIHEKLEQCHLWEEESLESLIRQTAEQLDIGAGKLIHPIRIAITGMGSSPGLFEVMVLLGRERVIDRLEKAIQWLDRQT
ncbi:glutamate--tRNA ligase [bacterium]